MLRAICETAQFENALRDLARVMIRVRVWVRLELGLGQVYLIRNLQTAHARF